MKHCNHNAKRDRESSICNSCYMADYRNKHPEATKSAAKRGYWKRKKENPEKVALDQKYSAMKFKYGLTKDQYIALMEKHNYRCAL